MRIISTLLVSTAFVLAGFIYPHAYSVGDKATDFSLKNIDGKMVSLSNYTDAKGFIVIFTCNHCPFSVAYEDRIIALDKKYAPKGYPVIAINPNDDIAYPDDSYHNMIKRAKDKKFTFPYLRDESQEVAKGYGASRTPHVYVLHKSDKDLIVKYIGAIDDNSENANAVSKRYVEDAVNQLLEQQEVKVPFTKAIGCSVKWKKS